MTLREWCDKYGIEAKEFVSSVAAGSIYLVKRDQK